MNKKLLIVAHAPSPNTERLLDAVIAGASSTQIDGVTITSLSAFAAAPKAVIDADGILLGTTENLGYMSGALKDFFDRTYYPVLDKTRGKPFSFWIRAGHDGTGTRRAIDSITTGLGWRLVIDPLVCKGVFEEMFIDQCRELGMSMAAGLDAGIF